MTRTRFYYQLQGPLLFVQELIIIQMNRNKSEKYRNLKIEILSPIKKETQIHNERGEKLQTEFAEKQLKVRKKHQIECLESQVKKLTTKIDSEKKMLKNRMIAQELEQELRKNQIAAQMSKRQIILQKLGMLKNQKFVDKMLDQRGESAKEELNNVVLRNEKKNIQEKKKKKRTQNAYMSTNTTDRMKQDSEQKRNRLRQIVEKQKQYGKRAFEQFRNNRAKSALSFLELRRAHQVIQLKKTQERQKILEDLKKPRIQHTFDRVKQTKKYINSIEKSDKAKVEKIEQLNYLSDILANQISQNKEGDQSALLLAHLNKVRTKILLQSDG